MSSGITLSKITKPCRSRISNGGDPIWQLVDSDLLLPLATYEVDVGVVACSMNIPSIK